MTLSGKHINRLLFSAAVTCLLFTVEAQPTDENMPVPTDTAYIEMLKRRIGKEVFPVKQKQDLLKLEDIAQRIDDKELSAFSCKQLAQISSLQAEYRQTIKYLQKVIPYFEHTGNKKALVECYCILGNMYSLLSIEYADSYYLKASKYADPSDSVDILISRSVMAIYPESEFDKKDPARLFIGKKLNETQAGCVNYLIAHALVNEKKFTEAFPYLEKAADCFSEIPERSYMDALCKNEFARWYIGQNDFEKAKRYLAESRTVCERDHFMPALMHNLRLTSEAEQAEGDELKSLSTYKAYIGLRDDILGMNTAQPLTDVLMSNLLLTDGKRADNSRDKVYRIFFIALLAVFTIGTAVLFHLRTRVRYHGDGRHILADMREKETKMNTAPQWKQYVSKIMLSYKKGLDYCINRLSEKDVESALKNLNRYIDETNLFLEKVKERMDIWPYADIRKTTFAARESVDTVVHMREIGFAEKRLCVVNEISENTVVFGDKIFFAVAFDYLLFRTMENANIAGIITLSERTEGDKVVFLVSDPAHRTDPKEKEVFDEQVKIGISEHEHMHSISGDLGVCMECVYQNNGFVRLECVADGGTRYCLGMPKQKPTDTVRKT